MIIDKLNAAFPLISNAQSKWITSFCFGLFVFIFLYTFQPFGISTVSFYKPLFITGYGLITFFSVSFCFFILPLVFKSYFNKEKWTVKKTITFSLIVMLLISTVNWYYTATIGEEIFNGYHSFIKFIGITLSIGIFPTTVFILFLENILRSKNEENAQSITKNIHSKNTVDTEKENLISLNTDKKEYQYSVDQFICAKSEGNYIEVFHIDNKNKLQKDVIRLSLKNTTNQLPSNHNIHQCHRSYIANFNHIEKVSGNARNYELHLQHTDFTIPVSRSFSKDLIALYK
ncbi:LytR/AlgR family response regulator transcription factor [Flammeovirga pacifica]|uniref:HTH LytTR-type domain-containing protein n=1 Tax=Flammeovirga pacifica TaxID=915059 RepID=A0A1S1Z3E8_FLAPC|nr:LytTR family DNA-binding domain-containing protein [Flammeovirga pacifica]OHX67814.1 hypothetical protein NH26_16450 [Flammeovirga pacifica]